MVRQPDDISHAPQRSRRDALLHRAFCCGCLVVQPFQCIAPRSHEFVERLANFCSRLGPGPPTERAEEDCTRHANGRCHLVGASAVLHFLWYIRQMAAIPTNAVLIPVFTHSVLDLILRSCWSLFFFRSPAAFLSFAITALQRLKTARKAGGAGKAGKGGKSRKAGTWRKAGKHGEAGKAGKA